MVNKNFPLLKNKFLLYRDTPYQDIIKIVVDENNEILIENLNFFYQRYRISAPTRGIKEPIIKLIDKDFNFRSSNADVFEEIITSYSKNGKECYLAMVSENSFINCIISHNSYGVLSNKVYRKIDESLKEFFGEK